MGDESVQRSLPSDSDAKSASAEAGTPFKKLRVAFLNTHPIQYFAPLYAYLNASDDISITGIYLSDYSIRGAEDAAFGRIVKWDLDLLAGYEARFVRGASKRDEPRHFFSMLAPGLWEEIHRGAFDALIVHGHTPAAMLLGVVAAKMSHTPVFMRGETHLGLRRSAGKAALRRPVMNALYRSLDGVLAIGSANREFCRAMGVSDDRIFSMPYAVDNERFTRASRLTDAERKAVRTKLGVQVDRPVVLYAAKLQPRKRPGDLIQAANSLDRDAFDLVMVGSGELERDLRARAEEMKLKNVHFVGFINQSELPKIYGAADVFVLPSEDEPWGLGVNEAMCAGLPIVASQELGCTPDLVKNGENGFTIAAGDISGLAQALRSLIADAALRRRMSDASRKIIAGWSYAECREGLRVALASVSAKQRNNPR